MLSNRQRLPVNWNQIDNVVTIKANCHFGANAAFALAFANDQDSFTVFDSMPDYRAGDVVVVDLCICHREYEILYWARLDEWIGFEHLIFPP